MFKNILTAGIAIQATLKSFVIFSFILNWFSDQFQHFNLTNFNFFENSLLTIFGIPRHVIGQYSMLVRFTLSRLLSLCQFRSKNRLGFENLNWLRRFNTSYIKLPFFVWFAGAYIINYWGWFRLTICLWVLLNFILSKLFLRCASDLYDVI